jgi:mitotic-spindle organizing protein 1
MLGSDFCRHNLLINTDYHAAHTINTFNQAITFLSNKWTMPPKESKLEKAREVVDILEEISMLLVCTYPQANERVSNQKQNTQLDRSQLSWCVSLLENGVNPEALAVCENPAI